MLDPGRSSWPSRADVGELEAAWNAVHEATPPGWYVGRASEHPERGEWLQYAFDPRERPVVGLRRREWTAIARSELEAIDRLR